MELNGSTVIRRPPEAVFEYVADVSHDRNWRTGLDESRIAVGEDVRVGTVGASRAGDVEVRWRVDVYEPGVRIEWTLLGGPFPGRGGYLIEPIEEGTRFTLLADIEPAGAYKILGPLFRWMGRRRNQADVEKLRDILEAGAV
jgi:hypothetical protein